MEQKADTDWPSANENLTCSIVGEEQWGQAVQTLKHQNCRLELQPLSNLNWKQISYHMCDAVKHSSFNHRVTCGVLERLQLVFCSRALTKRTSWLQSSKRKQLLMKACISDFVAAGINHCPTDLSCRMQLNKAGPSVKRQ